MNNSVEKVFEKEESSKGVTVCLKMCIATVAGEIANAAQAIQEADLTSPTIDKSKVKLKYQYLCIFYNNKLKYLNFETKLYSRYWFKIQTNKNLNQTKL